MKGSVPRPLRGQEPLATPWVGHAYKANDVAAAPALFAQRCESMTRRTLRDLRRAGIAGTQLLTSSLAKIMHEVA
jgi:hypothetical protein